MSECKTPVSEFAAQSPQSQPIFGSFFTHFLRLEPNSRPLPLQSARTMSAFHNVPPVMSQSFQPNKASILASTSLLKMSSELCFLLSISAVAAPRAAAGTMLRMDLSPTVSNGASNIFQGGTALQEHDVAAMQHHVQAVWGREIPRTLLHKHVTILIAAGLAVVFLLVLCFKTLGYRARVTSRRLAEGGSLFDENCHVSLYNRAARRMRGYGTVA